MALINLESKQQIYMLGGAFLVAIVAIVLINGEFNRRSQEDRALLGRQYEDAQMEMKRAYDGQLNELNQRLIQVDQNAKRAAEEARKAAIEAASKVQPVAAAQQGAQKKQFGSLALKTPVGKRALTVEIDSLGAVGGLLNAGDFVDVIAHLDVPDKGKDSTKKSVTAMIFQNLQVLAVNTNLEGGSDYDAQQQGKALKVTFALEPQESSLLSFADKNGKLELALRSPSEKGRKMVSTATWSTLSEYVLENNGAMIDVPEKPAEVRINKPVDMPNIQIYRGGRREL